MLVRIIADQETHLMIAWGDRYAIVERRNNRPYNCHDGKRDGIPLDNISQIDMILDKTDWMDQAAAQAEFDKIVARGIQLGQTLR